ncbi:DUF4384 domain-containing protein [Rhodobacteraceae bacterium 2376]|uniref:DUF4384 domain-containing protein n=1 Tax=Rhabdonatronobacter sediminivivens TaxID=2743469 RepID=A0A7Z0I1X9_9RHOB|nr:DUF4384 domain-containing protein [Rhabdonatronobacter sediminivivens]NYS26072.1 DUF4384 domain-containing protein [Rhabdonatronobacter sediminivivens]
MTAGRGQWAGAAAASVLAHLAVAAGLAVTLSPPPVPPQPPPEARFDLSAQPVEQVTAIAQPTDGAAVPEGQTGAPTLPPGTVPVARAAPLAASGPALSATDAPTAVLAGQPPPGQAATVVPPSGAALSAEAPPGAALTSVRPPAATMHPVAAPTEAAPPATTPGAERIASTDAAPEVLSPAPAQTITAAAAPAPAQGIDAAPTTGEAATAAPLPQLPAPAASSDGPRLSATAPGGQALAGAAPRPASAPAVSAVPEQISSASAEATALAPAPPAAEAAPPAHPPADALTTTRAEPLALASLAPVVDRAPASAPPAQAVAATATKAPTVPAGLPEAPLLPSQPPQGAHVLGSPPGDLAQPAAPASAAGARAQAALAWSGADRDQIDPVSLAAIQSFMQPAELARLQAGDDPVRDGISALLASVPCARMQTVFLPETGTLELRGHVPDEGLRDPVLEALIGQVGAAIPVADNLRILPRPQCEVLTGIADLGLPQSTLQDTDPRLVGPDAHAREYHYLDGDTLTFEVTTPDYPAHVYIDFFDADGMVLHLQPNEMLDTVLMDPKSTLTVGVDATGTEIFSITVAPPFGNEIAVAFAASTPVHEAPRPVREPAGPYLDWLHERIAAVRAADPEFKGEWVYFFMSTAPRRQ